MLLKFESDSGDVWINPSFVRSVVSVDGGVNISLGEMDGNFSVKGELGDIVRRLKGESVTSVPVATATQPKPLFNVKRRGQQHRQRFSFEALRISRGEVLRYFKDDSITAKVMGRTFVEYRGERMPISHAAKKVE